MSDRLNEPNKTIRDTSYTLNTPSLTGLGHEPVPEEIIRDLFLQEWVQTEAAPLPTIAVQDDIYQSNDDTIIIAMENYQEQPIGIRHEHVDIEIPLTVTIRSRDSRQRVRDLMGECRRIVYVWMLALRPYQCLYFDGFQAEPAGPGNWGGIMRIRLTAGQIPLFERHVSGATSPNTNPEVVEEDF